MHTHTRTRSTRLADSWTDKWTVKETAKEGDGVRERGSHITHIVAMNRTPSLGFVIYPVQHVEHDRQQERERVREYETGRAQGERYRKGSGH